jgi:hypothetical protein
MLASVLMLTPLFIAFRRKGRRKKPWRGLPNPVRPLSA